MKFTKYILGMIVCTIMFAMAAPVMAALFDPVNGFGVGTTNAASTLSWAVVPARSANGGAPAVSFINAGSATATSKIQFYKVTGVVQAKYATNTTVTLSVASTNGFASGDVIIIRRARDETYEKRTLTTMTTATNLVLTAAPTGAVYPGDYIYRVSTTGAGHITWGASTNSLGGIGTIYVGQKGMPLLLEIDASGSTASLNAVGGIYLP